MKMKLNNKMSAALCFGATGLSIISSEAAGLFSEIPGLSMSAQNSLVAHFDARFGVDVDGDGGVLAWQGRDGNGNSVVTANAIGNTGTPTTNITRNAGNTSLVFTETDVSHTRALFANMVDGNNDNLVNGGAVTIFWKGFYSGANPQGNSSLGRYAYNLSTAEFNELRGGMNHQRRDLGSDIGAVGAFVTAVDSTAGGSNRTVLGDSITNRNDVRTVWTSSYTLTGSGGTIDFSATDANFVTTNLNVADPVSTQGTHVFDANNQPTLYIGAISQPASTSSSTGGFSFIGEMDQLLIFEGDLSNDDIQLIQNYLVTVPEPSGVMMLLGGLSLLTLRRSRN